MSKGLCNFRLHQYRYLLLTIKDLQKVECMNSIRDRNIGWLRLSLIVWLRVRFARNMVFRLRFWTLAK